MNINVEELEQFFDVNIKYNNNTNKWEACYYNVTYDWDDIVAEGDTLEDLSFKIIEWDSEFDESEEEYNDSDWARSIDYGGYDTEDEFWEHLYKI